MSEIEYNYRTIDEIIHNITLYSQFGIVEILVLILLGALFISAVIYAIPAFRQLKKLKSSESEKKKKKLALKQIVIQKEIEEEIEKELKQEQEERLGK